MAINMGASRNVGGDSVGFTFDGKNVVGTLDLTSQVI